LNRTTTEQLSLLIDS